MSTAVSKTERFLKIGPFFLWFGMNSLVTIGLGFQRELIDAIYFLTTFFLFGSLIIGHFGYFLFPKYLASDGKINKEIGLSIITNIGLLILGIASVLIMADVLDALKVPEKYAPASVRIGVWFLLVLLGMVLMASIRLAGVYHDKTVQKMEYQVNRAQSELMLLKNQISPHFLFNTLNNIYGLAYLGDTRAAEMISRLSQIMRYLLYDCEQDKVPLTKESELIEYYLSLQNLKYEEQVNVDFYNAGIKYSHFISPMILINFVENCFKHSDLENNSEGWINIHLEVDNNELIFRTENTIKKEMESILFQRNGIGLDISKKLLEMNYPGKHKLNTNTVENVYSVELIVEL